MKPKQKWRLINDGEKDPYMHFAIEEALLRLTDESFTLPTLRLRQTEPSVWIGYYQHPQEDVDLEFCKKANLKIVRRPNPGGAVYQDEGTFCYSAFFNKEQLFGLHGIQNSDALYPLFGNIIIHLCKKYGIEAHLSPVNDITVDGRKIYGSAQLEWYSAFVHSGSILVNVDKEVMQAALKPSNLKFADKGFKTVRDRVINLAELSCMALSVEQVKADFVESFAQCLGVELEEQALTLKEQRLAEELYHEKYSNPAWTFRTTKPHSSIVSTKIASGVLTLRCDIMQSRIQNASLSGDFLAPNQSTIADVIISIKGKDVKQAIGIVAKSTLPIDVKDGICELLTKLYTQNE